MIKMAAGGILVAIAVVSLAGVGCSKSGDAEKRVQASRGGQPLALDLGFSASTVTHTERLIATFSLKNVSTVPVWLNERMSFSDEVTPGPLRELWIRVRGVDGTPVRTRCVGKSLPAKDSDYKVLEPGRVVSNEVNVSCLGLTPGDYQLIARFADTNEHPPFPPDGAIPFVDREIQSPVVSLKID